MEIHKTTNKELNDLFNEARQEKPVMDFKEVDQVIKDGKYTPSAGSRGFHIGMNNLIVVAGIVVSSFLAYMALKVDRGELATVNATSAPEQVAGASAPEQMNNIQQSGQQQSQGMTSSPAEVVT